MLLPGAARGGLRIAPPEIPAAHDDLMCVVQRLEGIARLGDAARVAEYKERDEILPAAQPGPDRGASGIVPDRWDKGRWLSGSFRPC